MIKRATNICVINKVARAITLLPVPLLLGSGRVHLVSQLPLVPIDEICSIICAINLWFNIVPFFIVAYNIHLTRFW